MRNAVHVKSWLTYIHGAREIVDDAWRQRASAGSSQAPIPLHLAASCHYGGLHRPCSPPLLCILAPRQPFRYRHCHLLSTGACAQLCTTIRSRIDGIRGGSVLVFEGFFSLLLRVIRKVCMCAIYIGIFVYESVYFFTWVIFSFDKYLHDGDYLSFCCLSWRQLSRIDFTVESNILLMMMTISREGRWIFIWPGRSLISFFVSLMRNIEVWLVMLKLLYA